MAFLCFLFWVICNGRVTVEILLFGLGISAAAYAFLVFFMDYKPVYDLLLVKNLPRMLRYVLILISEIGKANLTMAGFIFASAEKPEPVLVTFRAPLTSSLCRVLLANSITLTPGTITVAMQDGEYQVHCYDKSLAVGLDSSVFVTELMKLEEGMRWGA